QCHGNGKGDAMNPSLFDSVKVRGQPSATIRNILYGQQNESVVSGKKLGGIMPAMDYLTDQEIADVATYVRARFGNVTRPVFPEDVAAQRPTEPRSESPDRP
ncbi:MAG: cytochrome c, partial [Verrucomicrobiia bacterium]